MFLGIIVDNDDIILRGICQLLMNIDGVTRPGCGRIQIGFNG